MAGPHTAGVALLYLAGHPSASSTEVGNWLDEQSTKDALSVEGNSPDRLLCTGGL